MASRAVMGLGDPAGFENLSDGLRASANSPVFHSMLPGSAMARLSPARRFDFADQFARKGRPKAAVLLRARPYLSAGRYFNARREDRLLVSK